MKRSLCTEPDKAWALRYLREAKVDLSLTEELNTSDSILELVALALKKAQLAIQYAVGQPEHLELAVTQAALGKMQKIEPPVGVLLRMRRMAGDLSGIEGVVEKSELLRVAEVALSTAETIVSELVG